MPEVSASWFGETLIHPGGRVGVDVTVLGGGRHRLLVGSNLALYRHAGFHTGVLLDAVAGYRFTFDSGVTLDGRLGAGYLRTFLDGDTFARAADGSFERRPFAGANAFAPVQSFSVGYDFSRLTAAPLTVFAGLTSFVQLPFNEGAMLHVAGQLGLSWRFGLAARDEP